MVGYHLVVCGHMEGVWCELDRNWAGTRKALVSYSCTNFLQSNLDCNQFSAGRMWWSFNGNQSQPTDNDLSHCAPSLHFTRRAMNHCGYDEPSEHLKGCSSECVWPRKHVCKIYRWPWELFCLRHPDEKLQARSENFIKWLVHPPLKWTEWPNLASLQSPHLRFPFI